MRLIRTMQSGKESTEYMALEHFFGLMRLDGMCCVSATRKSLLDARLNIGSCYKKGDFLVVDHTTFRKSLDKTVENCAIDLLLLFRNIVQRQIGAAIFSPKSVITWLSLKLWAISSGRKRIEQRGASKELANMREKRCFLLVRSDLSSPKRVFSEEEAQEAIGQLVHSICPTVYAPDDGQNLRTAFPENTPWREQHKDVCEVGTSTFVHFYFRMIIQTGMWVCVWIHFAMYKCVHDLCVPLPAHLLVYFDTLLKFCKGSPVCKHQSTCFLMALAAVCADTLCRCNMCRCEDFCLLVSRTGVRAFDYMYRLSFCARQS